MKRTEIRLAYRQFHEWIAPQKTVAGVLSLGIILVLVGSILLPFSSISSGALTIIGGVLLAVGILLSLCSIFLCIHALCVWYVQDEETQTIETAVTTVADSLDGECVPASVLTDKRAPNGVLRDNKQFGSLTKKHVTISPRSTDSFSSAYLFGRPQDEARSSDILSSKGPRVKSGTSSASSSDMSTLASFAYLNDPSFATPYSSLTRQQIQSQPPVQLPVQVQRGYGSVPFNNEFSRTAQVRPYDSGQEIGQTAKSNILLSRRHSDNDYDNTGDMTKLLPNQSFHAVTPSLWQQQVPDPVWQQQPIIYGQQPWQPAQTSPQQSVWQYKTSVGQPNWRQINIAFDEPPPLQPLVRPSQRRPMTFEQMSSSKVSLYDNMQMGRRYNDDE